MRRALIPVSAPPGRCAGVPGRGADAVWGPIALRAEIARAEEELKEQGANSWYSAKERAQHAAEDGKMRASEMASEMRNIAEEIVREAAKTATKKARGNKKSSSTTKNDD